MYEALSRFAGTLASRETRGVFCCGTMGLDDFERAFYALPDFADVGYGYTLERYGVEMSSYGFEGCDVEHADLDLVRALLTACVRQDRFCDGLLGSFAASGFLDRCLSRLGELDCA